MASPGPEQLIAWMKNAAEIDKRVRGTEYASMLDPKSHGGNNTLPNAQNTCRNCNLDKGTRTTREYEEELRRRQQQN